MKLASLFMLMLGVGALIVSAYAYGLNAKRHQCTAPCTVNFTGRMAEDDVAWDYQGNGTVFIFKNGDH